MAHTAQWGIKVFLAEEGDATVARAVLDTGDTTMHGEGDAQRSQHDADIPEIGRELAAGRALVDLGRQLVAAAAGDIESIRSEHRAHLS